MRILQLCPTMHRAGTWYRCFYLSRALARRGHAVTLVKVSPESRYRVRRFREEGVELVETPRFWGGRFSHHGTRLPSDILARMTLVARSRFDVVHTYSHHFNAMVPGLAARWLFGSRALVVDWDDLWTEGGLYGNAPEKGLIARANYAIDAWSERRLKVRGDGVTVVSDDLRCRAIRDGVPEGDILLLPNGAPVDVIRPGSKGEQRRNLGLPSSGEKILIYVGWGQYDLDLIFRALEMLAARGVRPFTVFVGPHPERTQGEAERRHLSDRVRVAGLVSSEDLYAYLAAADVGLMPYADKPLNRARWPVKVGDYLAAGLPIATCDVGEMGPLVRRWNVGYASSPDAQSFAESIRNLVEAPDLDSMSTKARLAAEELSWDRLGAKLESFYVTLLNSHDGTP